jgi:hypothetical protein
MAPSLPEEVTTANRRTNMDWPVCDFPFHLAPPLEAATRRLLSGTSTKCFSLINSRTDHKENASTIDERLQFEEFTGDKIPKYAILSHRWEEEELSY